jgi:hypothetical protein
MILLSPKSIIPRKRDTIITTIITTDVEASVCFGVGQVTFLSSIRASFRNCLTFVNINLTLSIIPEPSFRTAKMAGQEGLEPPASGFGVRRSIH